MIENAVAIVLLLLAAGALALQRLYSALPVKELKRLAARGDSLATPLYRVAVYGAAARLLLWAVIVIGFSLGLALLLPNLALWLSVLVVMALSISMFVLLPSLQLTQNSAHLAVWFAPTMVAILSRAHGLLDSLGHKLTRLRSLLDHSRLYEKEDLLNLLAAQKQQADNRISPQDLEIAQRAMQFGDRRAADIARPRSDAHLVSADETVGPLLLDQLHKQQLSSFLVYKDTKENIVGSLAMSDAIRARQGGRVFDLVKGDLAFVHEDFSLPEVLTAMQKTGQRLVIVINSFEEFVGIITFEQLLTELLGESTGVVTPNYGNRQLVAAWTPEPVLVPVATDEPSDSEPEQGPSPVPG
ncbi:MAG TPA: CBS domain-containing protein [Candidatus Saccharimonadales bacterium]